uniref:Uncharacterized protein n=1 Tax=Lactuca sativa TaxID=4236 RepID=A0A9R1VSQ0_LACSA|nr:hypothetical protein LSAT_V11C400216300 [Lactuca sativa]
MTAGSEQRKVGPSELQGVRKNVIAPVIHEWTYDAMCHDLLEMEGNKYVHVVSVVKTGDGYERKEVLLEDHDPVWLELRHSHIADASECLHDKMTNFVSGNKAAQMHGRPVCLDGGEMSTRDLQKMVQALPQYNEQMDKLSLHVDLAGKINGIIRKMGLRDVGQLEQDLVFGDAGTKDIIKFLKEQVSKQQELIIYYMHSTCHVHKCNVVCCCFMQDATYEQKIRLLMIYVATHPKKFETDKLVKMLELANFLPEDMKAIYNMRFLESAPDSMNNLNSGFPLKFDKVQDKNGIQAELEEEIKFQKDLNNNLTIELNKTQESNLEVVSILQELDEQIEQQKLEKNSLEASEQSIVDEDNVEEHTGVEVSRITTKDNFRLELELQKFQESQENLNSIVADQMNSCCCSLSCTRDGTSNAPALHEDDIGHAMGIQGTEVAKESSDIINVFLRHANIQKFIQFQLALGKLEIVKDIALVAQNK